MNDHDLDRILSRQQQKEEIAPSSGFAFSVMDAVKREAAIPAPIPFPWKRALPGLVISLALAIVMIVGLVRGGVASTTHFVQSVIVPQSSLQLHEILTRMYWVTQQMGIGWILFALLLSLITAKLSMRLAAGKS